MPQAAFAPASDIPSVLLKLQKWGDYPGYGEPVAPTRFIPCKTPLSCKIVDSWTLPEEPKYGLTLPGLLSDQSYKGRRIGLLLDLSNHETLYAEDLPSCGIQYVHIHLVAKAFPEQPAIDRVIDTAQTFWRDRPDEHIAIHCAYGFNRTGFVVCAYLVLACGLTVDDALSSFEAARPPGVRHEKFVDELRRRYDSPKGVEEAAAPSRSSMGSLRSDMATVAEFLDSGPGLEALSGQALHGGPLRQELCDDSQEAHSAASCTPSPLPSSWGQDSMLLDPCGQPADWQGSGESCCDRIIPTTSSRLAVASAGAPPTRHVSAVSRGSISSQASVSSLKNDSLSLDQQQILDHFHEQAAEGNNAARAENKGRRRSSEGSRRWQRSVLPCITADCELDSFDPLPQTSPPVGRSQQGRLALNDCSPGKHQPLQHMSSPFAGVPGDFDDQPQLASASCSNGSQSQARTRGNKALEQGRGSQLETIKGTSLKDTSPRCMIM